MTIGVAASLIVRAGFDGAHMAQRFAADYESEPWWGYAPGPPGLLLAVVVGSGVAAAELSPGDVGLPSFANPAVTVALFGCCIPTPRRSHPTSWFRLTCPTSTRRSAPVADNVPEVLFVCVRNAGRSQMAAALLTRHGQERVSVRSAGSTPADEIHVGVREAMAEVGVDLSGESPKLLTDQAVEAADVVITMGCGDACPVYPGKRYLDWAVPDPAGRPVEEVRPIRNEIDRRVRDLLAELGATGPARKR